MTALCWFALLSAVAQQTEGVKLYLPEVAGMPDKNIVVPVLMDNDKPVVALQFNVTVPQHVSISTSYSGTTDRFDGHTMKVTARNGYYQVLVFSTANKPFKGYSGEVCNLRFSIQEGITVGQQYPITISDAIAATADGTNVLDSTGDGTLFVQDTPDFTIENLTHDITSSANPDDSVHVSWTVHNIGQSDAQDGWNETIYLRSKQTGVMRSIQTTYYKGDNLAANASVNRSCDILIPTIPGMDGDADIFVKLNPYTASGELASQRENNTASSSAFTLNKKLFVAIAYDRLEESSNYGKIYIEVMRSGNPDNEETYPVTLKGDERVTLDDNSVVMQKNISHGIIYATLANDNKLNDDDNYVFTIDGSAYGYGIHNVNFTYIDDEIPHLSLTASKSELHEGDEIELTISAERAPKTDLEIQLTGTPSERFRFPQKVIMPAGKTEVTVKISVIDDDIPAQTEQPTFAVYAKGYQSAEAFFILEDDDVPVINLTLTPTVVSEGAGLSAVMAHLERTTNIDKKVTIVMHDDSNGQIYYPQLQFTMQPGQKAVDFYLGIIDDSEVNGDRTVNISAGVYISSCNCSVPNTSIGGVKQSLTITDNDGPTLTLVSSSSSMREGSTDNVITLSRNTDTTNPLTVTITSDADDRLSYSHEVTIPAGEKSVNIKVSVLKNDIDNDDCTVVFIARADGFSSGSCWSQITDQTKPDAIVSISLPVTQQEVGTDATLTVVVSNQGFAPLPAYTRINLYRDDASQPFASVYNQTEIAEGSSEKVTRKITFPDIVGKHYYYALINESHDIKEINYANNRSEEISVTLTPAFTATAKVSKKVLNPGEKVTISGHLSGNIADNSEVEVYIINNGTRMKMQAVADKDGNYSLDYSPDAHLNGHFAVGACYPGDGLRDEMDAFDIYGLTITSGAAIRTYVTTNELTHVKYFVRNAGILPLSGAKASLKTTPSDCDAKVSMPSAIGSHEEVAIDIQLTGKIPTQGNRPNTLYVQVETAEGAALEMPLYYYVIAQEPALKASESSISTTIAKGKETTWKVILTNTGKGETGDIEILLPKQAEWLSLASASEIPSLAKGDSATVIFKMKQTEQMQLNVPVKAQVAVNSKSGNGMLLYITAEPVSTEIGSMTIDVCDENTYFPNAGGPHLKGAHVIVRHPARGNIIAEGYSDENGLFKTALPEGYYAVSVSADGHDQYGNNLRVDAERDTYQTVNLSMQGVTVTWNVVETTVEDVYEVNTTVKYEVNLPIPNVVTTVPDRIPADELAVGESLIFYATLTNKGLMTAQQTQFIMPEGFTNLQFEPLVTGEFDIPAGESIIIPVRVTRIGGGPALARRMHTCEGHMDNDPCVGEPGTLYAWDCGTDRKWHRYGTPLHLGACGHDDVVSRTDVGGGGGGGGWSLGWGWGGGSGWGGGGTGPYVPSSDNDEVETSPDTDDCEPCQNRFLVELVDCGLQLVPAYRVIKAVIGCASGAIDVFNTFNEARKDNTYDPRGAKRIAKILNLITACNGAMKAGKGDKNQKRQSKREKAIETLLDVLADITVEFEDKGWDGVTDWNSNVERLGALANTLQSLIGFDYDDVEEMFCALKLLKPCDLTGDPANARGLHTLDNSGNEVLPSWTQDYRQTVAKGLVQQMSLKSIEYRFFGATCWLDCDDDERDEFMQQFVLLQGEDGTIDASAQQKLIAAKPGNIKPEEVTAFIERWNNSITGNGADNSISVKEMDDFVHTFQKVQSEVEADGYESISELYNHDYDIAVEKAAGRDKGVCGTISFKISQKLVMTRQAFEGTLTVHNGSKEVPITNARLNLTITDEDGNVATLHEFQTNMKSLTGFDGKAELGESWSLSPDATGSAVITFIPTRYAAETQERYYAFGGSLSYVDPFSGSVVTRQLMPITLAVQPSPVLELQYFMQRDIMADDPLTADVVEKSVPAEFALVIHNKGYGDAKDVKMLTHQPEVTENEKGVLIDLRFISSQLNGEKAALALDDDITSDFGTIKHHSTAYAQWWMESSLLGHFIDYKVETNHLTSFDNPDLSLLDTAVIHELVHGFTYDVTAKPVTRAFLVNDVPDGEYMPDMIHFSDGREPEKVTAALDATATEMSTTQTRLTITSGKQGWNYGSITDPANGQQEILSIVRESDGKVIALDNFWQTDRTLRDGRDPLYENRLHFIAEIDGAEESYIITFTPRPEEYLAVSSFEGVEEGEILQSAPASVDVIFNKDIDASTFTGEDLSVSVSGKKFGSELVSISRNTDSNFTLGLSDLLTELNKGEGTAGYYVITVQTAGITDAEGYKGRNGKSLSWIVTSTPTDIRDIDSETTVIDVYSLSGQLILKSVPYTIVNTILPPGIYVVKGNKLVVK